DNIEKNGKWRCMRQSSPAGQLYGNLGIFKLAGQYLLIILIILTLSTIAFSLITNILVQRNLTNIIIKLAGG
ncbi:MAG: hypothetical protein PHX53_03600, partial [Syntrophales bacterium]|nr:hypothetical protein [Syntrophales bacterium]